LKMWICVGIFDIGLIAACHTMEVPCVVSEKILAARMYEQLEILLVTFGMLYCMCITALHMFPCVPHAT